MDFPRNSGMIAVSEERWQPHFHARDWELRLSRQGGHRQKRGKSRQAAEHELHAYFERVVLADRNPAGQVSEQHHRAGSQVIKKLTRQMKGLKSFGSASVTLVGIEVAHTIRKGQFEAPGQSAFQQFSGLAG
ncbi:hypothetical protein [Roseovarius sp. A-2]|uniref:hypothetical protein n=1 Tax=Roseovarius sp. A-2 TaxID=1570360 RepID=UPI0035E4473C